MLTSTLALSLFTVASTASPILYSRAGGPIAKPVPANCTIDNPVLCTSSASCPEVSYTPFRPTNATLTSASSGPFLYGYYLQPTSFQVTNGTSASLFEMCLNTCYGYGTTGTCKSVYQAYNYPTPPMFGAPGGDPSVACLLFGKVLDSNDFEIVPESQRSSWTDQKTGVIKCPST